MHRFSVATMIVVLAGCGTSQTAMPRSANSAALKAKPSLSDSILYVSTSDGIAMFSYPRLRTLGGLAGSLGLGCPDDATGDIYFSSSGAYVKYAIGGSKRIGSIQPPSGYTFQYCSAEPTSGDLATIVFKNHSQAEYVAIYAPGSRRPKKYSNPEFASYFDCTYDDAGNLFVIGELPGSGWPALSELPKGSGTFINFTLNEHIAYFNPQWDGHYVTTQTTRLNHRPILVYRVAVSGSTATVVGTVALKEASVPAWIDGQTAISAQNGGRYRKGNVTFYDYPAGGKYSKAVTLLRGLHIFGSQVARTTAAL